MQQAYSTLSANSQEQSIAKDGYYEFTTDMAIVQVSRQDSGQDSNRIISLGIPENESIEDAHRDMDILAWQSFKDCD